MIRQETGCATGSAWIRETFYDETRVAIVGMGFCFPGYNAQGADLSTAQGMRGAMA